MRRDRTFELRAGRDAVCEAPIVTCQLRNAVSWPWAMELISFLVHYAQVEEKVIIM